jgi:hypothetical protein
MSELFTSGSVGGAAGNCCLYPASETVKCQEGKKGAGSGKEDDLK